MVRGRRQVHICESPKATNVKARGAGEAETPGKAFYIDGSLKGSNIPWNVSHLPASDFIPDIAPGFSLGSIGREKGLCPDDERKVYDLPARPSTKRGGCASAN